jgi:hypothetical protein
MADHILDHVVDAAGGAVELGINAAGFALSTAAKVGPGLVADTVHAAGDLVSGIEGLGRNFADNAASAITPSGSDNVHPFSAMLAGLDLNLGLNLGRKQDHNAEMESLGEFAAQLPQMAQFREKSGAMMTV